MGRPKQFDVDKTLERAMIAFWAHGYTATSLQDLLAYTGMNRSSLYNSFGDKRRLFLETLLYYEATRRRRMEQLEQKESSREAILSLFEDVQRAAMRTTGPKGCFLINAAVELAPHDGEVCGIVDEAFHVRECFFRKMIERGLAVREIEPTVAPGPTAQILLTLYIGLLVCSEGWTNHEVSDVIVQQAEALLPTPSRGPSMIRRQV